MLKVRAIGWPSFAEASEGILFRDRPDPSERSWPRAVQASPNGFRSESEHIYAYARTD
jgi:hypothetical protein